MIPIAGAIRALSGLASGGLDPDVAADQLDRWIRSRGGDPALTWRAVYRIAHARLPPGACDCAEHDQHRPTGCLTCGRYLAPPPSVVVHGPIDPE